MSTFPRIRVPAAMLDRHEPDARDVMAEALRSSTARLMDEASRCHDAAIVARIAEAVGLPLRIYWEPDTRQLRVRAFDLGIVITPDEVASALTEDDAIALVVERVRAAWHAYEPDLSNHLEPHQLGAE